MKPSNPATIDQVTGEYYFMMAYTYFALARRYGGVPLITEVQEFNGDYDAVKVPRSTEVATWKFILEMCDKAAASLPDATTQERANKWTAYALKSRAALYAASVGKFWDRNGAMLTGEAVTEKLVGGFTDADVKFFYEECIKASAEVIRSGKFSLYGENPASLDEAAQNYHKIFVEGKGISEVIFLRDYVYPGIAHNMGKWHEPNQLAVEYGGRCCRRSIWSSRMPLSIRRPAWELTTSSWSRPTTETRIMLRTASTRTSITNSTMISQRSSPTAIRVSMRR